MDTVLKGAVHLKNHPKPAPTCFNLPNLHWPREDPIGGRPLVTQHLRLTRGGGTGTPPPPADTRGVLVFSGEQAGPHQAI